MSQKTKRHIAYCHRYNCQITICPKSLTCVSSIQQPPSHGNTILHLRYKTSTRVKEKNANREQKRRRNLNPRTLSKLKALISCQIFSCQEIGLLMYISYPTIVYCIVNPMTDKKNILPVKYLNYDIYMQADITFLVLMLSDTPVKLSI